MKNWKTMIVVGLLTSPVFYGCGPRAPEGFPSVYDAKVKILKKAEPLKGIQVMLVPEGAPMHYVIAAKTDDAGIANIQTIRGSYVKNGAPEGNYRIVLRENVEVDMPRLSIDEIEAQTPRQREEFQKRYDRQLAERRQTPANLGEIDKTPLRLTVASKGVYFELETTDYQ